MAQNTTVAVGTSWVQITNADATTVTFQNTGESPIWVKGTTDTTAPTNTTGAIRYDPHSGELSKTIAEMFVGASFVRLWAVSEWKSTVAITHA